MSAHRRTRCPGCGRSLSVKAFARGRTSAAGYHDLCGMCRRGLDPEAENVKHLPEHLRRRGIRKNGLRQGPGRGGRVFLGLARGVAALALDLEWIGEELAREVAGDPLQPTSRPEAGLVPGAPGRALETLAQGGPAEDGFAVRDREDQEWMGNGSAA